MDSVRNVSPNRASTPVSYKEGKEHGYGLSNISQAAGRRDGHMEYHVQNGYFVLDVTFSVE